MVLPDLTTYLATQSIGTAAVDLFYGVMPEAPDAVVVLFEYFGHSEPTLGGTTINIEWPLIQARSRGIANDYDGPRLKLQQVVAAFARIGGVAYSVGGVGYKAVIPKGGGVPGHIKLDANFRHHFTVNFEVMKDFSNS